jgi:hypothetical protein
MFGPDFSTGVAAAAGMVPVPVSRPPPEQRVVEDTARAELRHQHTRSALGQGPSELQQLSESARQFADLLDTTGNLQVASAISGFRAGHLDMYI